MNGSSCSESINSLINGVLKGFVLLNKETESNFGMSSSRILTLLVFTEKKIMSMNQLSKAMSLSASTSTRMIDGLVKEGFVERKYDQLDRRLVIVGLTGKGKRIARNINAFREKYFDSINDKVKDNGEKETRLSLKILIDSFGSFKSQL